MAVGDEEFADFALEDEQFADFAVADTSSTASSSSSPDTPGWAIALIVLGCIVLVALIVVQVQLQRYIRHQRS